MRVGFTEGEEVEVGIQEEGFQGSWYTATIIRTPKREDKEQLYTVDYHSLTDETNSQPLRELIHVSNIRPRQPPEGTRFFDLNEDVDVYFNDGWWQGAVIKVLEGNRYSVYFTHFRVEMEFGQLDLRTHMKWIDGKWVKSQDKQKNELVEVRRDDEDCRDAWFPATVLKKIGSDSFLVEYNTLRYGGNVAVIKETVGSGHIRPSPPSDPTCKKFDLLQKVDAFFDFGWWSGMITRILPGDKYAVFFKYQNTEKTFSQSQLRLHMEWIEDKWLLDHGETSIIQHNEGEISIQPSPSAVKGSLKRKFPESGDFSKKMNASYLEHDTCGNNLPVGSESDVVTEVERPVLLLTLPMEESTGVLPEAIMSSETITREDVSMEEDNTTRDEQNEPAPQSHPMEATTSTSSSSSGRGHGEILPRSFPFVKTSGLSYLWKIIDSMSVFVSVPQQPHFCPLDRYDENLREGLALGYMASFANLVENISATSLHEPRNSVEHKLLALDELEEHGFTVHTLRSRLLKVLQIKDNYRQLEDDLVEVERKITEEKCENGRLEEEMAELQEYIMEKNKKLETVMVEKEMRGSIESEFERRVDDFRRSIQTARDEFYCKRDSFPTFVPKLISNC